ncbi:MAG: DUF3084 domain-containing protein [Phormidesmis sp.]
MTGFVLLFAVACLGGVIATVGDRIGMKVGKSRLSLFNLRPRQTATLVSVATGMVASFSTLMLLIALDGQLRKGLFSLDEIQQDLSQAQADLESTRSEKDVAQSNLEASTKLQEEAQLRLRETNRSLRSAAAREEEILASLGDTQEQLEIVSEQAGSLRDEIFGLRDERQALVDEQATVRAQIAQRDQEIAQRNEELAAQSETLKLSTEELQARNQQIAEREQEIVVQEARLEELQVQQRFLDQQIAQLENDFDSLRLGNLAIRRGENLEVILARSNTEEAARLAVESALLRANRNALREIWPGLQEANDFALVFDPAELREIVDTTFDERTYAIIVSSAANYVVDEPCVNDIINRSGEPCLLVNVRAVVNEVLYGTGSLVSSVQLEPSDLTADNLRERVAALTARAELQAERRGVIYPSPLVARRQSNAVNIFRNRVEAYGRPIELQAIASQPIYTLGPVFLELTAVENGRVLFRTFMETQPPERG